ALAPDL
ncbi:hypothetical protein AALP_AAs65278U000500, partial [Arabis alpina]